MSKGVSASNAIKLRQTGSGVLRGLFWVWGTVGFIVTLIEVIQMAMISSVGVGTSAYVTATVLTWIGGMVFFGLGSLVNGAAEMTGPFPVYTTRAPPRARGFTDEFAGIPFRLFDDKSVEVEIDGESYQFETWKAFVDYTKGK